MTLSKKLFFIGISSLLLASVACLLADSSSLLLEEVQFLAFPIFMLGFYILNFGLSSKISVAAFFLAFLGWGFSFLSVKGALPGFVAKDQIVLSRLSKDPKLEHSRLFFRRYGKLRREAGFPKLSLLERSVDSTDFVRKWLVNHPGTDIFLAGEPSRLKVYLRKGGLERISQTSPKLLTASSVLPNFFSDYLGSNYGDSILLKDPASKRDFVLLRGPEEIGLPSSPPSLAIRYIARLGEALAEEGEHKVFSETIVESKPEGLELHRAFSMARASEAFGPWRTNTPRGFANFIHGTSHLLADHRAGLYDEMGVCTQKLFGQAAAKVVPGVHPELLVAIFNNAAVAKIFSARNTHWMREARSLFWRAANLKNKEGGLAKGAEVAYANMIQLESLGAVPHLVGKNK